MNIFKIVFSLMLFVLCSGKSFSNTGSLPVGTVTGLKGKAFKLVPTVGVKRKKVMLKKGMSVNEADIIATEKSSYVELEMADHTTLNLAASSSFVIKKFRYTPGVERIAHYHQSWGAMRAKVKKPTGANESIQFNTKHVAVGAEDSEFLSNSYSVNDKPTNDLLLIKGKVNVNVDQLNLKTKNFELKEGMLFNSNMLIERGVASFPRIKNHFLGMLAKTRDFFLPRAQASNGQYVNVNKVLKSKTLKRQILRDQVYPSIKSQRTQFSHWLQSN